MGEGLIGMTLSDHQWEFLKDSAVLVLFASRISGYKLTGGDRRRSPEEQARLVAAGKSKTLNSGHIKKLADDFALFIDGVYQQKTAAYGVLGDFWESLSEYNVWGGRWETFPDGNHFERRALRR